MARSGTERGLRGVWRVAAASDVGRVRTQNEDSFTILDSKHLRGAYDLALIVADGMGGRNAGEVASRAAVEAVSQAILNNAATVDARALLSFAVEAAHIAIQQRAKESPLYEGMGTTLVIVLTKGENLWVAHVGDSRAYILRHGELMLLTEDHTFVAEQVRAGGISPERALYSRLRHMLTRAVGTNADYTPDIRSALLEPGDAILLCTDGLTNMVSEEDIARLVLRYRNQPERACQSLVSAANASGGQDNITVLLATDARGADTASTNGEELQTVSELPTIPDPQQQFERLLRRVKPQYVVAVLAAVAVLAVVWGLRSVPKPQPVMPPPLQTAPDLSQVQYASPQILLGKPLRGAPLVLDHEGHLYAMTEQGRILRIAPDGKILTTSSQPFSSAVSPDIKPDMVYFATDPQGNLYVCDRAQRRILKYRSDGRFLGSVGEGKLKRPAAIAVAGDGSVYVIDAGKLTVFRVLPAEVNHATQPNR